MNCQSNSNSGQQHAQVVKDIANVINSGNRLSYQAGHTNWSAPGDLSDELFVLICNFITLLLLFFFTFSATVMSIDTTDRMLVFYME